MPFILRCAGGADCGQMAARQPAASAAAAATTGSAVEGVHAAVDADSDDIATAAVVDAAALAPHSPVADETDSAVELPPQV